MKVRTNWFIALGVIFALAMIASFGYADGVPTVLDTVVKPVVVKATGPVITTTNWIQGAMAALIAFFTAVSAKYLPKIMAFLEKIHKVLDEATTISKESEALFTDINAFDVLLAATLKKVEDGTNPTAEDLKALKAAWDKIPAEAKTLYNEISSIFKKAK